MARSCGDLRGKSIDSLRLSGKLSLSNALRKDGPRRRRIRHRNSVSLKESQAQMFEQPWLMFLTPVGRLIDIDDVELASLTFDHINGPIIEREAVRENGRRTQQFGWQLGLAA